MLVVFAMLPIAAPRKSVCLEEFETWNEDLFKLKLPRIYAITNEIKNTMGSEETLIAGAYKVTWTAYTTTRFDSTRFKKDHADLASEYTKSTTTRRFCVR